MKPKISALKNFRIVNAERDSEYSAQRKYIFEVLCTNRREENAVAVFAALDDSNNVIGYIFAKIPSSPKPAPPGWYIDLLFVEPEYRRQGVATALFEALESRAKEQGVQFFVAWAMATERATMFWYGKLFCMEKSSIRQEDPTHPLEYGNYKHIIHRRVCPAEACASVSEMPAGYKAVLIDTALRNELFDRYLNKNDYFSDVRNELFGFAAVDERGEIVGYAVVKENEMGAPLDKVEWLLWHFVEPRHRKRGIGTYLLHTVNREAEKVEINKPAQLHPLFPKGLSAEDEAFYMKLGYNIAYYGTMTDKESGEIKPWAHVGIRM